MTVFQIDYDLNSASGDYEDLYDAIEGLGDALHILESTWLVESEKDASEVRDILKSEIDSDDTLFIAKIESGGYDLAWVGIEPDAKGWLDERL